MSTLKNIRKIIIFRALQLGDMLCAIPAVRVLRSAFPKAEITLAGLPWARSLTERFAGYFDNFIHFPGYPGLPEQPVDAEAFTRFLQEVQANKYDLALQMQGNGSIVNPMVELFGARYTAGFFTGQHYYPQNGLFLRYPDTGSEIERHLRLMAHLGIASCDTALEFPLTENDYQDFYRLDLPVQPGNYVCVHPGSRGAWRQWPPAYFAALADYCIGQGLRVVITGTESELPVVAEVQRHMRHKPLIAAGKTSLGAVAVLIKNAFALISNCTGVSHIAAALETPSIVISMDGEPGRWAPLNGKLHRVTDWTVTPDFELVLNDLKILLLPAAGRKAG
ncbi:glycosyltransferase family 9 protein [Pedobacter sp. BS3]|uniref:glycosyltransferase family 9 protein n=1 Tax=Pedobacter sp. BS3 TaxID=2567937 RepID=UPI0011EF7476|nr:glycosyltransferase family 9 protein [Pedobacter sp. BS3]TZF84614.1 glycosyltransferase family 9 protein [Pedobacter sp. BS3]